MKQSPASLQKGSRSQLLETCNGNSLRHQRNLELPGGQKRPLSRHQARAAKRHPGQQMSDLILAWATPSQATIQSYLIDIETLPGGSIRSSQMDGRPAMASASLSLGKRPLAAALCQGSSGGVPAPRRPAASANRYSAALAYGFLSGNICSMALPKSLHSVGCFG